MTRFILRSATVDSRWWENDGTIAERVDYIELSLEVFVAEGGHPRYDAVKADGVPIEKLRRVQGFVENKA